LSNLRDKRSYSQSEPIKFEEPPIEAKTLENLIKSNISEGEGKHFLDQIENLVGGRNLLRKEELQKQAILDSIHHQYIEKVD